MYRQYASRRRLRQLSGHACLFTFSLFFLRFSFPLCRSPFSPSFSFRLFLFSFSVFFLLAFFAFLFDSQPSFVADSVISSPWYSTLCAAREPASLRVPMVYSVLSGVLASYVFLFWSSLPSLCRSQVRTSFVSSSFACVGTSIIPCLLCFGFCCDSFRVWCVSDTYVCWGYQFLSEVRARVYTICCSHCVLSSVSICFPPEVTLIFHSRVIGACRVSCDLGLHVVGVPRWCTEHMIFACIFVDHSWF